jgi:hypothetical protein
LLRTDRSFRDAAIVETEIPDPKGIGEAGGAQFDSNGFHILHQCLPICVGPRLTIALRNDPTCGNRNRGSFDWKLVGVPSLRKARDISSDIVGVHTFGEIAGAKGGVEIKGDSAIRNLDATENVDVEGEGTDLFRRIVTQKIGFLGVEWNIPGRDCGICGGMEVSTRVSAVGLDRRWVGREVPIAVVAAVFESFDKAGPQRGDGRNENKQD